MVTVPDDRRLGRRFFRCMHRCRGRPPSVSPVLQGQERGRQPIRDAPDQLTSVFNLGSVREHALSTGVSLRQWKSMSTILRAHPPHYRPITPAFNIGSKSIRHWIVVSFLWPRKWCQEASYRNMHSTETISNKVGTAVAEFGIKPVQLRF